MFMTAPMIAGAAAGVPGAGPTGKRPPHGAGETPRLQGDGMFRLGGAAARRGAAEAHRSSGGGGQTRKSEEGSVMMAGGSLMTGGGHPHHVIGIETTGDGRPLQGTGW